MYELTFYQYLFLVILFMVVCLGFFYIGRAVNNAKMRRLKTSKDYIYKEYQSAKYIYKLNLIKVSDRNRKLKKENLSLAEQLKQEKEMFKSLQDSFSTV